MADVTALGPRRDEVARDARELDVLSTGGAPQDPLVALLAVMRDRASSSAGGVRTERRRAPHRAAILGLVSVVSSVVGVSAAAAASHPGGLLYGVRRITIGRTTDDATEARRLLQRGERVMARPHTARERAVALALASRVQDRLPDLRVREAHPLSHRTQILVSLIREERAEALRETAAEQRETRELATGAVTSASERLGVGSHRTTKQVAGRGHRRIRLATAVHRLLPAPLKGTPTR